MSQAAKGATIRGEAYLACSKGGSELSKGSNLAVRVTGQLAGLRLCAYSMLLLEAGRKTLLHLVRWTANLIG